MMEVFYVDAVQHGILDMTLSRLRQMAENREAGMPQSMGSQNVRHNLATEQWQQYGSH